MAPIAARQRTPTSIAACTHGHPSHGSGCSHGSTINSPRMAQGQQQGACIRCWCRCSLSSKVLAAAHLIPKHEGGVALEWVLVYRLRSRVYFNAHDAAPCYHGPCRQARCYCASFSHRAYSAWPTAGECIRCWRSQAAAALTTLLEVFHTAFYGGEVPEADVIACSMATKGVVLVVADKAHLQHHIHDAAAGGLQALGSAAGVAGAPLSPQMRYSCGARCPRCVSC